MASSCCLNRRRSAQAGRLCRYLLQHRPPLPDAEAADQQGRQQRTGDDDPQNPPQMVGTQLIERAQQGDAGPGAEVAKAVGPGEGTRAYPCRVRNGGVVVEVEQPQPGTDAA